MSEGDYPLEICVRNLFAGLGPKIQVTHYYKL